MSKAAPWREVAARSTVIGNTISGQTHDNGSTRDQGRSQRREGEEAHRVHASPSPVSFEVVPGSQSTGVMNDLQASKAPANPFKSF